MERSLCRSLRVHRRHTPTDRDSTLRSFTPTRRSTGALRLKPTCSDSSQSPLQAFTKCHSPWSAADSCVALQGAPALSKCSSLPRTFQSCDERQNSIDHDLCAAVLGRSGRDARRSDRGRRFSGAEARAAAASCPMIRSLAGRRSSPALGRERHAEAERPR